MRRALSRAAWSGCCGTSALTLLVTLRSRWSRTIWLYVVMPKGFLPLQDTGLITAVTGGGRRMSRSPRCSGCSARSAARSRARSGRRRRRLGGRRRAPINPTPNAGRLTIDAAAARRARARRHRRSIERLEHARGRDSRRDRLLPAGAGHPDRHARQPRAVPVHADRHRRRSEVAHVGAAAARRAARPAGAARRRLRQRRTAACALQVDDRPRHAPAGSASRCRRSTTRSTSAFGQRQISHHLRAGQPVPRGAGGRRRRTQRDPAIIGALRVPGCTSSRRGTTTRRARCR